MAIFEGCSIGTWVTLDQELWGPTGKDPNDFIYQTFGVQEEDIPFTPQDATLEQGLPPSPIEPAAWRGFVAQAIAAILNAQHPEVNYPLSPQEVRNRFQGVIDNPELREAVELELEQYNELDCPLR